MTHSRFFSAAALVATLGLACSAEAALYLVGPTDRVSDALNQALAVAGEDEIRIVEGVRPERVVIDAGFDAQSNTLLISGGWNAEFSERPGVTELNGSAGGQVMNIGLGQADRLTLDGLVLGNGRSTRTAGLLAALNDQAGLELEDVSVVDNVTDSDSETGGGVRITASDTSWVQLNGVVIGANQLLCSVGAICRGGGLLLSMGDDAEARLRDVHIQDNRVISAASASAGGAAISLFDASRLEWEFSTVTGNSIDGLSGFASGWFVSSNGNDSLLGKLITEANIVAAGSGMSPANEYQASFSDAGGGIAAITDSLVANSNVGGLRVFVNDRPGSQIFAYNLTIADNLGVGLRVTAETGVQASVANTIVFGNNGTGPEVNLSGDVVNDSNLLGVDPLFMPGSYVPGPESPAVDAGNNTPFGGVTSKDLRGGARIINGQVDIGAYEVGSDRFVFADGFES